MTEEREHNPAPARKKPRFCEGCVLSALTVIAVRPPNDHSRAHATCFFSRVGWFNATHSVVVVFHVSYLPRAGGAVARPAARILPGIKASFAGSVSSGTRRWFYLNARRDHEGERDVLCARWALAILKGVLPHRRPAFSRRHGLAALDV